MSESNTIEERVLQLPSDQDATGRTLGGEEIKALTDAINTGTLTSTKGRFVRTFETEFARQLGVKHAYACASGTAAVHLAIAAINPNPGDEIITTPITDMGALTPILYQGAIPVFADVDDRTCNVTAATIEARLSPRTKAIVVTHLFGNPCEMNAIMELAAAKNLPVIEDCAQSFLSADQGRRVGTIGSIGCFSLQQGKHITTGEGGIVTTNDDALGRHTFLYINKAWGYGDAKPDHYFLALNYRMSELQGAVALAQLPKLQGVVDQRVRMAERLTAQLKNLPGIEVPWTAPGASHVYWKYSVMVDDSIIDGGSPGLAKALKSYDIASAPRYIQKPAFMCEVIRDQRTLGDSRWPFSLATPEAVNYDRSRFPGTFRALDRILVLPWNERYTDEHVDYLAASLKTAAASLSKGKRS
jgi:dTDP-4-amino-4,6-dideoxygalactose transaminase